MGDSGEPSSISIKTTNETKNMKGLAGNDGDAYNDGDGYSGGGAQGTYDGLLLHLKTFY